jgi:hypothetical protein
MGCGASSGSAAAGAGSARTEGRGGKNAKRDAIAVYVSTFLTQPIFHAQMQAALRSDAKDDEKARSLQALDTVRNKLADFCDVSGGAQRSAFNVKLRSSLSDAQCEAFADLRLDPVKLAHAIMDTLRAHPDCFPIHLEICFSKLMEQPGGLEDLALPPPPDGEGSDGSDVPDAQELEAMDERLGAKLGHDAKAVGEEFPDTPVTRKGKRAAPKVEISLGVMESFKAGGGEGIAARGQKRQEAMAELKRVREQQRKARRGSLPEVGSPKWVPELQNHPLRKQQQAEHQQQQADAETAEAADVAEGANGNGNGNGKRRRVKKSEKRAKQAARAAAAGGRRPSVPAIASPKWVTVDPNARLPAAITAKGKEARGEKKKHRRRRHSAHHHRDIQSNGNRRHHSLADDDDDDDDDEEDDESTAPLIVRMGMALPAHGKLEARERQLSTNSRASNGGRGSHSQQQRPGSAPMSPYEPPTPSVRPGGQAAPGGGGGGGHDEYEEGEDMGMSVEEFEARMAEWLEYNRQEKISPGTAIRPLPLKASKSKPHLVPPKTPLTLRASEVHSFNSRKKQQQQQQQLKLSAAAAADGGGGGGGGSARHGSSRRHGEGKGSLAVEERVRAQKRGAISKDALR